MMLLIYIGLAVANIIPISTIYPTGSPLQDIEATVLVLDTTTHQYITPNSSIYWKISDNYAITLLQGVQVSNKEYTHFNIPHQLSKGTYTLGFSLDDSAYFYHPIYIHGQKNIINNVDCIFDKPIYFPGDTGLGYCRFHNSSTNYESVISYGRRFEKRERHDTKNDYIKFAIEIPFEIIEYCSVSILSNNEPVFSMYIPINLNTMHIDLSTESYILVENYTNRLYIFVHDQYGEPIKAEGTITQSCKSAEPCVTKYCTDEYGFAIIALYIDVICNYTVKAESKGLNAEETLKLNSLEPIALHTNQVTYNYNDTIIAEVYLRNDISEYQCSIGIYDKGMAIMVKDITIYIGINIFDLSLGNISALTDGIKEVQLMCPAITVNKLLYIKPKSIVHISTSLLEKATVGAHDINISSNYENLLYDIAVIKCENGCDKINYRSWVFNSLLKNEIKLGTNSASMHYIDELYKQNGNYNETHLECLLAMQNWRKGGACQKNSYSIVNREFICNSNVTSHNQNKDDHTFILMPPTEINTNNQHYILYSNTPNTNTIINFRSAGNYIVKINAIHHNAIYGLYDKVVDIVLPSSLSITLPPYIIYGDTLKYDIRTYHSADSNCILIFESNGINQTIAITTDLSNYTNQISTTSPQLNIAHYLICPSHNYSAMNSIAVINQRNHTVYKSGLYSLSNSSTNILSWAVDIPSKQIMQFTLKLFPSINAALADSLLIIRNKGLLRTISNMALLTLAYMQRETVPLNSDYININLRLAYIQTLNSTSSHYIIDTRYDHSIELTAFLFSILSTMRASSTIAYLNNTSIQLTYEYLIRKITKISFSNDHHNLIKVAYVMYCMETNRNNSKIIDYLIEATKSNIDPYFVSLVTILSFRYNKLDEYDALCKILMQCQSEDGSFKSAIESPFSSGESLVLETTALALMAWSKKKMVPDQESMAMQYLITHMSNNVFGSFHSTVICYKALKFTKHISNTFNVTISNRGRVLQNRNVLLDEHAIECNQEIKRIAQSPIHLSVDAHGASNQAFAIYSAQINYMPTTRNKSNLFEINISVNPRMMDIGDTMLIGIKVEKNAQYYASPVLVDLIIPSGFEVNMSQFNATQLISFAYNQPILTIIWHRESPTYYAEIKLKASHRGHYYIDNTICYTYSDIEIATQDHSIDVIIT